MNLESFPGPENERTTEDRDTLDSSFAYEENVPDPDKESQEARKQTLESLEGEINGREKNATERARKEFGVEAGEQDPTENEHSSDEEMVHTLDTESGSLEEVSRELEKLGIKRNPEDASFE